MTIGSRRRDFDGVGVASRRAGTRWWRVIDACVVFASHRASLGVRARCARAWWARRVASRRMGFHALLSLERRVDCLTMLTV